MGKIWKVGLRWISLLGVAGILLIANGCGGGGGGDNAVDSAGNNAGNNGGDNGGRDTTPNAFNIAPQIGVAMNAEVTSAPFTVTGIDSPAPITVSNGSYSIGSGPFVTTAGTVNNNQTVRVRHIAAAYGSTSVTTTLNIGGINGSFRSTTVAPLDTTPDRFSFTPQTNTPLGAIVTSNEITVSGLSAPASITVYWGSYSIDNGPFTTASQKVNNGQRVAVRHTAATTNNTVTLTRLNINGTLADFVSSTGSVIGTDTTPDRLDFVHQTNVPLNTVVTSLPVTVTGIDAPAVVVVYFGTYSINDGEFTSAPGIITNGQTIRLRHTSAANYSSPNMTAVEIDQMPGSFRSMTVAAAGVGATRR